MGETAQLGGSIRRCADVVMTLQWGHAVYLFGEGFNEMQTQVGSSSKCPSKSVLFHTMPSSTL